MHVFRKRILYDTLVLSGIYIPPPCTVCCDPIHTPMCMVVENISVEGTFPLIHSFTSDIRDR